MDALDSFVQMMHEGKLTYSNGELWRHWEMRRGWLPQPKRAEKEVSNGYYTVRATLKEKEKSSSVMAHRVIWAYFNGPIPDNLVINHKNGIKSDNRIENLEVVTQQENVRHALENGLVDYAKMREFNNSNCKLSDKDVLKIRELLDSGLYLQREIADMFGVRPNQISRIKNGKRRAHV